MIISSFSLSEAVFPLVHPVMALLLRSLWSNYLLSQLCFLTTTCMSSWVPGSGLPRTDRCLLRNGWSDANELLWILTFQFISSELFLYFLINSVFWHLLGHLARNRSPRFLLSLNITSSLLNNMNRMGHKCERMLLCPSRYCQTWSQTSFALV